MQPPDDYDDCLNSGNGVCDVEGATCLQDDTMNPMFGVCAATDCVDECDCPAAPMTGDAPVTCGDILAGGGTACFLDCSSGQTCPTGMDCFDNFLCLWPDIPCGPLPSGNYDDCLADSMACDASATCLQDDTMNPMFGVCATTDCVTDCDCPAGPGTGTAQPACDEIIAGGGNACFLDCSGGQTCPTGMSCQFDSICMWDAP